MLRPRHLALLDDLLLELAAGAIDRLMVTMPPRHGKSETCSHWFPTWMLRHFPETRILLSSYEASFAASWGRRVRDSLAEAYKRGLSPVTVRADVSAANNWQVEGHSGGMVTAGVGGAITGLGADLLIIDDPTKNAEEANSLVYREKAWEWWRSTAYTRLEPGGKALMIATRWHMDDLPGRVLEQEADRWHVINLPALAEEADPLGRAVGEVLWPERYPLEVLQQIKRTQGSYWWAALYQQKPTIRGEAMIRAELIAVRDEPPAEEDVLRRTRSWDLAGTEGGGDWTAGVRMAALRDGHFLIEDVRRFQKGPSETRQRFALAAQRDGYDVTIVMEQEPGQSGKDQIENYRRTVVPGYKLKDVRASTDKTLRADPLAAAVEDGLVEVMRGGWNGAFIDECETFPHGAHDDQVDAAAGAYTELAPRKRVLIL